MTEAQDTHHHNGEHTKVKLNYKRLTPNIGALVEGIKLNTALDAPTIEAIKEALVTYHVLFFRNQELDPSSQRDLAANFGKLQVHPIYPTPPDIPEIVILDTGTHNPPDSNIWHSDVSCIEKPPMGAILACKQLPEVGGDTSWSSMIAAYDALSEPFRTFLNGLQAVHDITQAFPKELYQTEEKAKKWEKARLENPPVVQPVIRTHPVTGRKGIYVNESFTTHILNLTPKESDTILKFLFAHIGKPEFTVRWRWNVGDVVFWDNRLTQHYALADYLPNRRVMHRAVIEGDKPFF
jgi:taurine dioxygenase